MEIRARMFHSSFVIGCHIMKTTVNILATCRSPELLPATLLVFETLRTGFPTAGVTVFGNGLGPDAEKAVYNAVKRVGGAFIPLPQPIAHGQWIEQLLDWNSRPVWICDTDVVFFDEVENFYEPYCDTLFAGRFEPSFNCEWTRATHVARLHPSLMFLNAPRLRVHTRAWPHQAPFFNTVERNLFHWQWVPVRERVLEGSRADLERLLFYDTCAGLFHALGGEAFDEKQNAAFEHLYSSTYLDLIKGHMPPGFAEMHERVYRDPSQALGLYKMQSEYYRQRMPKG